MERRMRFLAVERRWQRQERVRNLPNARGSAGRAERETGGCWSAMPEALRCQPEEEWAWSAASALCWCERLRDGRQRFGGGGGGGGGMPSGLWASPVEGLVLPFLDSLPGVAECNKPRAATTCLLPIWQQGVTNQELQQALVMRLWSWGG